MQKIIQFPTFLGIGTVKSGSTWLHYLLESHPEIWMPWKRAEPQFFDRNYEKGKAWYGQFFPENSEDYKQVGECTPRYIEDAQTLERIKEFGGIEKFIISFRNPVERLFSQYKWHKRNHPDFKKTFEAFINEHPGAVKLGCYAQDLKRFFHYFDRDSLLILVFEEMVNDVNQTKERLGQFLDVDPSLFPEESGQKSRNKSFTPKFGKLYSSAAQFGKYLRNKNLYGVEKLLRKTPLMNLVSSPGKSYQVTKEDRLVKKRLYDTYEEDIRELRELTGMEFKVWEQQQQALFKVLEG